MFHLFHRNITAGIETVPSVRLFFIFIRVLSVHQGGVIIKIVVGVLLIVYVSSGYQSYLNFLRLESLMRNPVAHTFVHLLALGLKGSNLLRKDSAFSSNSKIYPAGRFFCKRTFRR